MDSVLALSLFILTIALLVRFRKIRFLIALSSAILAIALGLIRFEKIYQHLNLDVLGLIAGA